MEEHHHHHHHHHPLSPLAVTHLLQHTLRSLCIHENSQWIYAVFWRILPRNYPPPKWEGHGAYDHRSRGNRRNWILVWEDGFCNFGASTSAGHDDQMNGGDCGAAGPSVYGGNSSSSCDHPSLQQYIGLSQLQPELFFKMSHEIYNYGEGLIGKVAADHSHKWIHKEPNDQEINFLSAWHNSADSHPRTWEAQFQSGIKTIALIAVREGVVQLGGMHKVVEDLSYVVLLRKKFSYIESIPGVLLPHPSSSLPFPYKNNNIDQGYDASSYGPIPDHHPHHHHAWHFQAGASPLAPTHHPTTHEFMYDHHHHHQYLNNTNNQAVALKDITPSMSSLEALLSKLPSVVPTNHDHHHHQSSSQFVLSHGPLGLTAETPDRHQRVAVAAAAKEEITTTVDHDQNNDNEEYRPSDQNNIGGGGDTSTSVSAYGRQQQQFHHHI